MSKVDTPGSPGRTPFEQKPSFVVAAQNFPKGFTLYFHRWLVLGAYTLTYFVWNWWGNRYTIIAPAAAQYHDTTTEVRFPGGGIDFLNVFGGVMLIVFYLPASWLVDKLGIITIIIANVGLTISCWTWYLSKTRYNGVLIAKVMSSMFGPLASTTILGVSNRWFGESERALATAVGSFVGLIGGGASILIGPLFETSDRVFDASVKSCQWDKVSVEDQNAYLAASLANQVLSCQDQHDSALEAFCCYTPTDVESYNLLLACIQTFSLLYAIAVVRNRPPTPPSAAGDEKEPVDILKASKHVMGNRKIATICVADFFLAGPPSLLFAKLAVIMPVEVADQDVTLAAAAIAIAIPSCIYFSKLVGRTHKYFEFCYAGYVVGTATWLLASIGFAVGNLAGGIIFLISGGVAVVAFILWQVAEYELKLEYAFDPDVELEGIVAGWDRIVANLATVVYTAAFPPERVGTMVTMWVGFGSMMLGLAIASTLPEKRVYLRHEYEIAHHAHLRLSVGAGGMGVVGAAA